MDNKMIALIVIILVVIVGAVYLLANTGNTNQNATANTTNVTNTTNNTPTVNNETRSQNNTTNNTVNVTISSKKAQQIAVGAEKDLTGKTVTAGSPTLFKWTANNLHTWVWNVPIYDTNGTSAGEIDVDAYTGEVIMNE
jgi:uncharacterized membrane protein YkoI